MRRKLTSPNYKSNLRQWIERNIALLWYQLSPEEYELFECGRRDVRFEDMSRFLPMFHSRHVVRPRLNEYGWRYVLGNKWAFHLHMTEFGVRVPPLRAVWLGEHGLSFSGARLKSLNDLWGSIENVETGIIVKPIGGQRGQGIVVLPRDQDFKSQWESTVLPQLQDHVHHRRTTGFIVQEIVRQHDLLETLAPFGLNTIRIITLVDMQGVVHVQRAALRLTRAISGGVDNWRNGSLRSHVDVKSGVMSPGQLRADTSTRYELHPETGREIAGQQLPFWTEVRDLVDRAARSVPGLRSVGWDVGITNDGPVLIEGNYDWGVQLTQGYQLPYLDRSVTKQLSELGIVLDTRTRLRAAVRFLMRQGITVVANAFR